MSVDPQNVLPRRNPNLIERIANAITLRDPGLGPQPAAKESTQTGVFASTARALAKQFLSVENTRSAVYRDVDEMDDTSEETSTALDTIADNATTSEDGAQLSWAIKSDDAQVQTALEEMAKRTELHQVSFGLVRNLVKRGDVFGEIVVNGSPDGSELWITKIKQLPPQTMVRNQLPNGETPLGIPQYDEKGAVTTQAGSHAFEQFEWSTNHLVAAFLPWQIAHFRHNWDGEGQYGESMMKTSRQSWRKLMAEEQALVIGRLMRAFMKLVWYVDTTGLSKAEKQTALKAFQESVQVSMRPDVRRDAPFSVMNDIFVTDAWLKVSGNEVKESRTRVQPIDPKNEGMTNIADVEYIANKLLSTLRVPKAHMGFERDINAKATLTVEDVQYVRFLRRIQQEVGQRLTQICDTQLILLGYDPTKPDLYTIEWPRLSANDEAAEADAEFARAQADNIYLTNHVIDAEWVLRSRLGLDDEAVEELLTRIKEQQQAEQAQQQAAQEQEINMRTAALKTIASTNGNGKSAQQEEQTISLAELRKMVEEEVKTGPVKSRGGYSQEARLLAETIKTAVSNRVMPSIARVLVEQDETRALVEDQFGGFHPGQPRDKGRFAGGSGNLSGSAADPYSPAGIQAAIEAATQRLATARVAGAAAAAHATRGHRTSHPGHRGSHHHSSTRRGGVKVTASHQKAHTAHISKTMQAISSLQDQITSLRNTGK